MKRRRSAPASPRARPFPHRGAPPTPPIPNPSLRPPPRSPPGAARAAGAASGGGGRVRALMPDLHEADVGALLEALDPEDRPRLIELLGRGGGFAAAAGGGGGGGRGAGPLL